jgi:hypothetical protein
MSATERPGQPRWAHVAASVGFMAWLPIHFVLWWFAPKDQCPAPGNGIIHIWGVHIHHEVFGVIGLLVVGLVWLHGPEPPAYRGRTLDPGRFRLVLAVVFGLSAGAVLDEWTVLVSLDQCAYNLVIDWIPELITGLVLLAWIGHPPTRDAVLARGRGLARRLAGR